MAPRKAHGQAEGPTQGGTKRGPPCFDSADAHSRPRGGSADQGALQTSVSIAAHVVVVGVKRPSYGKEGRLIKVFANVCEASVPEGMIYQYDVQIYVGDDDKEKTLNVSFNRSLFDKIQNLFQDVFTPCAVYDGKKIAFASHELDLGASDKRQFDLTMDNGPERPPKRFIVCLTKASVVNLEVLQRLTKGLQSYDSEVQKALNAFNVVVRMAPSLKYPSHGRSFYMLEAKSIGLGLSACQGYFQSVRPAVNRLLINVDTTTGIMYKDGPLMSLCLKYLGLRPNQAHQLDPEQGLPIYERIRLQRFLSGMKIVPVLAISGARGRKGKPVLVKRLTDKNASTLTFTPRGGGAATTVAAYFQRQNQPLQYPHVMCVETPSGAFIPLEKCEVPSGQHVKKDIPPEAVASIVSFSTKPPMERLAAIKKGVELLQYNQSEYVKAFGLNIKSDTLPSEINARVLPAPKLQFGGKTTLIPSFGSWNMVDKHVYKAASIKEWMVISYALVSQENAKKMVVDLIEGCQSVGMAVELTKPLIRFQNGLSGNISQQLAQAGGLYKANRKCLPGLIIAILPDHGNSGMYNEIKHFGKFKAGVATQCLKVGKCINAKMQYWANVALKINSKLGGTNVVPASESSKALSDPQNATVVMGADVMHPSPGSVSPSYTALVCSIDKFGANYIAKSSMQTSKQEMISDLKDMAKEGIQAYLKERSEVEKTTIAKVKPKRLIFFRDGVSEGEFEQVLKKELPLLKAACQEAGVDPKITFIVVIKRHHIRLFSENPKDIDRNSKNLVAGTVVDQDITSPILFDWYLQSHSGIKGTSRSGHYTVLHDESNFTPDALQSLAYLLCYTFARATKSVSIPAPVYYAHIVCGTAKQHYDPSHPAVSDAGASGSTEHEHIMKQHKSEFKPKVHPNQENVMYWM